MFFSYLNNAYNQTTTPLRGKVNNYGEFAMTFILIGIIGPSLAEWMSGRPPDDDKNKTWAKWAAKNTLLFYAGQIPVVRDFANAAVTDYGYSTTPVEAVLKSGVWLAKEGVGKIQDGDYKTVIKKAVDVAGVLLKLPTDQFWITAEAAWMAMENDPDFEMKDLIYRKKWEQ
jgi:hypothetical protein